MIWQAPAIDSRPATATDRAYAFVKQRVLDSSFAGGDLITEGQVASAVGLSRTPVREAFLRLEAEGLLRLYPKRGALVVPVSAQEVEEVMETRTLVERFALERVLQSGDAGSVADALEEAVARQDAHAASGDITAFVAADREYHTALVAAAGNSVVTGLYESLRDRQQRMGLTALTRHPRRIASILDEHRRLAVAIRSGDATQAQRLLAAHLRATLVLLRER